MLEFIFFYIGKRWKGILERRGRICKGVKIWKSMEYLGKNEYGY